MKAILFSIGTRGDIEPFLAIAQLLKCKKWDVPCVFAGLHLGPGCIPNETTLKYKLIDLVNNQIFKNNAVAISEKMKTENDIDNIYDLIIS